MDSVQLLGSLFGILTLKKENEIKYAVDHATNGHGCPFFFLKMHKKKKKISIYYYDYHYCKTIIIQNPFKKISKTKIIVQARLLLKNLSYVSLLSPVVPFAIFSGEPKRFGLLMDLSKILFQLSVS